jgi:hypothetical protein
MSEKGEMKTNNKTKKLEKSEKTVSLGTFLRAFNLKLLHKQVDSQYPQDIFF